MKKVQYLISVLTLLLFLQSCQSTDMEISQWRGPNRDGVYPAKDLLKEWPENGPELIWKYDELGDGYASPAVLSDKIITIATIDSISYVIAFNHQGGVLYRKELGPEWMTNFPGINSTPQIFGDHGYLQGGLGILYCIDAETGETKWTKDLFTDFDGKNIRYGITENFVVDGDKLFVTPGGPNNNIIALNRFTGDLIWSTQGNGDESAYGCPNIITIGKSKHLINYTTNSLFSINPENGYIEWRYPLEGEGTKANVPVYRDGFLYAMAGYKNGLLKLKIADDGKSVEKIWVNELISAGFGDGVFLGDTFYAGSASREQKLCAINPNTGAITDSIKMFAPLIVISADEMIYTYNFRGLFSLVKPTEKGMEMLSSFKVQGGKENEHCSFPVIYDGRLFIRHDNSLFVYDISSKL